MYQGYLRLGSTEIANAQRVETYVRNLLPGFPLRGCVGCEELERALGESYNSPLQDRAPWIDPSNTATYDFLGFYPISVQGLDSSTVEATVTESTSDGGYLNSSRAKTRDIRVRGLLIATTELGLAAGQTWLNEAVAGDPCTSGNCNGYDLSFYAACPEFRVCYTDPNHGEVVPISGLTPNRLIPLPGNTLNDDKNVTGLIEPNHWDGLTFTWGVSRFILDYENYEEGLETSFGPVTPFRVNKVKNPRFAVGTAQWGTDGVLSRVATGGPDNDSFGRMTMAGAGLYHLQTNVTNAINGQSMLQFRAQTTAPDFTVQIRSSIDSSITYSQNFTGSTTWEEYSWAIPNARDGLLEFEVVTPGAGTFDITQVILEGGTHLMPYFDGSTNPTMPPTHVPADPGYDVWWLSTPNQSESYMQWQSVPQFEFCGLGRYAWLYVVGGNGAVTVEWSAGTSVPDAEQALPYERYCRDVGRIEGPTVTREISPAIGYSRVVEFSLNASTPFIYTRTGRTYEYNLALMTPRTFTDTAPPTPPPSVVLDPDCPAPPDPPRPPIVENDCVVTPGTWDRYSFVVASEDVSRWSSVLPRVTLQPDVVMRQMRFRTTPNPLGVAPFRTNLALRPYPNAVGGWQSGSAIPFPATLQTVGARRPGTQASVINRSLSSLDNRIAVWNWIGAYGTTNASQPVAIPNLLHTFSLYYKAYNAPSTPYAFTVTWFDAGGSPVGSDPQGIQEVVSSSGVWSRATFQAVAPATAARVVVGITFYTPTGGVASGDEEVWIQDLLVEQGNESYPSVYFDGAMADENNLEFAFTGPSFQSTSTATIGAFDFDSEFIVSYSPAGATIVVDSTTRRSEIYLSGAEQAIPAGNLLYGSDGGPMEWPEFNCGTAYFVTMDVPPGTGDDLELELELTRRE